MNSRKVQVDIGIKQNIKVLKARGVALGKKLIPSLGGYEVFFSLLNFGGGWCRVCHGQCAEVREELSGVCSLLLPPCGSQVLNLDHQVPLPIEPSHWALETFS